MPEGNGPLALGRQSWDWVMGARSCSQHCTIRRHRWRDDVRQQNARGFTSRTFPFTNRIRPSTTRRLPRRQIHDGYPRTRQSLARHRLGIHHPRNDEPRRSSRGLRHRQSNSRRGDKGRRIETLHILARMIFARRAIVLSATRRIRLTLSATPSANRFLTDLRNFLRPSFGSN